MLWKYFSTHRCRSIRNSAAQSRLRSSAQGLRSLLCALYIGFFLHTLDGAVGGRICRPRCIINRSLKPVSGVSVWYGVCLKCTVDGARLIEVWKDSVRFCRTAIKIRGFMAKSFYTSCLFTKLLFRSSL